MLTSEEHKIEILIIDQFIHYYKNISSFVIFRRISFIGQLFTNRSIEAIIASVTTAFLSAIALYFSAGKPKPLTLTTTDLIFLLFYLFVGLASVSIFLFMHLFPQSYYDGMAYTRWGLGVFSLLFGLIYLSKDKILRKLFYEKNFNKY